MSPAGRPIRRLVVGVDGSEQSRAALVWAAGLAAQLGAEVTAVHAVGLLEHMRHGDSQALLDQWCADGGCEGVVVRPVLRDGPPAGALLAEAEDQGADLIVVGSRGIGGAPETQLGSTSVALLQSSRRPVTVLP